jgi:BirA family biotin operon repressor/biotin-[acetyl-CoA-carboxylase] ligase
VVIADAQTAGRGRFARVWHSPPGENLYYSAILRPPIAPRAAPPLTLVAAVATAEAVAREGGIPELKWPNDLLLDGRKVAGILCEMACSNTPPERIEHVVLGIGVNLNSRAFPPELAARATSIALAVGRPVDRAAFAAALSDALERWYDTFIAEGPAPIIARWKSFARLFGRTITVDSGRERVTGVATDLDADGALTLKAPDGRVHRVVAGEIAP